MFASNSVYFEVHTDKEAHVHWLAEQILGYVSQFPWVGVLVSLMLLDVVTGIIAAAINKTVSSACSQRGVLKKVQMIILVGVGLVFEIVNPELPWGKLIAMLFIANEMISITENAGRAGLPLPRQLMDILAQSKEAEHGHHGEQEGKVFIQPEKKELETPPVPASKE